ncbi:MAG: hypothetical protein MK116_11035 [Phycisphaerales bacterium]|nr:hypothetical protein [Phycisphaerales bacterium]
MSAKFQFDGSSRIVVLVCRDTFLRSHYTAEMATTLESIHGEIDRITFDGEEASIGDVLEELQAVGLLHTHKLIIVDKADRFLASTADEKGPSRHRKALSTYAGKPSEGATLLLRAETWNRGKLDELVDLFRVEVDPAMAIKWSQGRCPKAHGVKIDPEAAELLVHRVGLDLGRLDGELEKLATIASDEGSVTAAHVREVVGASREEEAWAIKTSIVLDGPERSLETIREIFDLSRDRKDVPAFWAIIELLRSLYAASTLQRQNLGPRQVQEGARIFDRRTEPRKTAPRILKLAAAMEPAEAESRLRDALRIQADLRRGIGDPRHALEGLTVILADRLQALVPR